MRPMPTRSASALFGALIGVMVPASAQARTAMDLCTDFALRRSAAAALGDWAQNYPFSRVIIGDAGGDGTVGNVEVAFANRNFAVCRGSYELIQSRHDGGVYRVGIPQFFWRVEPDDSGFRVSLVDMPTSLDGSAMPSRELLSRFTIDGRPYTDVLAENQHRLQRQDRK